MLRRGDSRFYQAEAVKAVKDVSNSASAVAAELGKLVDLRMLDSYYVESGDGRRRRRRYYQKLESPLWAIVEAADAALGIQAS